MTATALKTLRLTVAHPNVTVVTLARGKQKNAFNFAMYTELTNVLKDLSVSTDPTTNAIVLTGEGDYYSSGNDLANFSQLMHPKTMAKQAKQVCYDFVDAFASCKKPLICAANGPSIGIATTTMGLCDVRICRPTSTFHTPFKALGQAPEGCSSYMFPRIVGPKVSSELLEGGRKLTAQEALEVGFVSAIIPEEVDLIEAAVAIARKDPLLKRFVEEEQLLQKLREVNQHEVDVLEKAWVSRECFDALSQYLLSRQKKGPAYVLKSLNWTRYLWDW